MKVIKKWQPPSPPLFLHQSPSFSGLSPLSSKIFGIPQVSHFFEAFTLHPLIRVGGVPWIVILNKEYMSYLLN